MPLDARIEAAKLRDMYKKDPNQQNFRLLLLSTGGGKGKTYIARTCRMPVHIDSWDPGGTQGLDLEVDRGDIIVDTRYETEDRTSPIWFQNWRNNFQSRERDGYFKEFGTYVLDSSTFWADAILSWVMTQNTDKEGKSRAGTTPLYTRDYNPQKIAIQNWMKRILNLPCDVIVTGHLKANFETVIRGGEEVEVITHYTYMTTGQGAIIIPLMFTEQWIANTEPGSPPKYNLITSTYRKFEGKTRMGSHGRLDTIEPADIKACLRKCGRSTTDKPSLFDKGEIQLDKTIIESIKVAEDRMSKLEAAARQQAAQNKATTKK